MVVEAAARILALHLQASLLLAAHATAVSRDVQSIGRRREEMLEKGVEHVDVVAPLDGSQDPNLHVETQKRDESNAKAARISFVTAHFDIWIEFILVRVEVGEESHQATTMCPILPQQVYK